MKNQRFLIIIVTSIFLLLKGGNIFPQTPFWQQTNGPGGGIILSLAANSDGDIFAGTHTGGLFGFMNDGAEWELLTPDPQQGQSYYAIAIASDKTIFAGYAGTEGKILRSMDNGDSWESINFGSWLISTLVIHPLDESIMIAGTFGEGIYRSEGSGDEGSWDKVFPPPGFSISVSVHSIAIHNVTGDVFAACTGSGGFENGVYKSDDDGISWTRITDLDIARFSSVAVDPNNGYIYAAPGGSSGTNGIYRSVNAGVSWHLIPKPISYEVTSWAFHNNNIYVGTSQNSGVYYSNDDGDSWTHLDFFHTVHSILINENGDVFAGTGGDGVYRLDDVDSEWTKFNNGLISSHVLSIASNSAGDIFAGTWAASIKRSMDNGNNWTQLAPEHLSHTEHYHDIAIQPDGGIFAAGGAPSISIFSEDNGDNWVPLDIDAICFAIHGDYVYAGTYSGVFRTTNNGLNWSQVGLLNDWISSIDVDSYGYIYAGTISRGVWRYNGSIWEYIEHADHENGRVLSLIIDDYDNVYAGISGSTRGIWRLNAGGGWEQVEEDLGTPRAFAINMEGHIFAAAGGVLRSTDNGNIDTWYQVNEGLTNYDVRDLAIDPSGHLYAATLGAGVFRSVETTVSDPIILIGDLINEIKLMNLHQGINNSLDAKLENAKKSLESVKAGNKQDAINKLQAFINECEAQKGKALTIIQADLLISKANVIITLLQM